jgi:deoxyribose-phosphate aldolase
MYIEYACYDYSLSDEEIKNLITEVAKLGIKNIATYHTNLPLLKNIAQEYDLQFACPIDYPYGFSDSKSRLFILNQAIKNGASCVDMTVPAKSILNRKYDKLREDIKINLEICQSSNIDLRYMLEYRVFNHETLAKACQIFMTMGISTILPSTGQLIDDINDNIIAAKYLASKSGVSVICNGNIWTKKQVENIQNSKTHGIRLHYLASLELFLKNKTI